MGKVRNQNARIVVAVSDEGFPLNRFSRCSYGFENPIMHSLPNRGRDESRRRKNSETNSHGDVSDLRRRLRPCRCLGAPHWPSPLSPPPPSSSSRLIPPTSVDGGAFFPRCQRLFLERWSLVTVEFGSLKAIKANGVCEGRTPKIDADMVRQIRRWAKPPSRFPANWIWSRRKRRLIIE